MTGGDMRSLCRCNTEKVTAHYRNRRGERRTVTGYYCQCDESVAKGQIALDHDEFPDGAVMFDPRG